jgi:hypothetical protein
MPLLNLLDFLLAEGDRQTPKDLRHTVKFIALNGAEGEFIRKGEKRYEVWGCSCASVSSYPYSETPNPYFS